MKPERWQQVDKLFQAALDRAPQGRAAFLDGACGGDGKELFYISADQKLMAAEVKAGDAFEVGASQALFEVRLPLSNLLFNKQYVTNDGQRFLVDTSAEAGGPSPITVVLGWAAELKQ